MSSRAAVSEPQRILYINVSRIGDTLLATPAIRAVARAYPHARLTVLGHPKRAEVFENLSFVDSVGRITKQRAWWRGRFRGKQYDLAFVCGHDAEILKYALRVADKTVAFRQHDREIDDALWRIAEEPPFQTEHAVKIQLRLPSAAGIPAAGMSLAYQVTPEESAWAGDALAEHGLAEANPLIGLQIASFPTKAYRDWPVERFAELADRVQAAWPEARFAIFGGALEADRTNWLAARLGDCATCFAGRLTLRQTAALMQKVHLYVGVDTGPTHIMGALHRPMVALYHGYSPSRVLRPLDHPSLFVVDHPMADKGATPETSMSAISVDQVWSAVSDALAAFPPAKG